MGPDFSTYSTGGISTSNEKLISPLSDANNSNTYSNECHSQKNDLLIYDDQILSTKQTNLQPNIIMRKSFIDKGLQFNILWLGVVGVLIFIISKIKNKVISGPRKISGYL